MPLIRSGTVAHDLSELMMFRGAVAAPDPQAAFEPATTEPWLPGRLDEVLCRRRALRDFEDREVAVGDLADLLVRASSAERSVRPPAERGHPGLTILVAAPRVEGLSPGIHLWRPAARRGPSSFAPLAEGTQLPDVAAAYTDAAALVFVCGEISAVRAAKRPEYGSMLVRSGSFGYGVWLSAIGSGLAGCLFGRAHREITEIAQQSNPRLRHLFTVAVGHPSTSSGDVSSGEAP